MRNQWCREHIDEAAEYCDLTPSAVRKVKQALKFTDEHPGNISQLATDAVLVLAKERDKEVLDRALATTEEKIKSGQQLSAQEVKGILLTARGGTTPGPDLVRVVKQMQANPPTKPPISREEGEIKPKEKPSQTTSQLFDIKKQFPFPGTREEILFRQQVKDMGRWIKLWLGNPDLAPLHPILEGLQRATQETYGDLVKS
jgi:hypothetical protein